LTPVKPSGRTGRHDRAMSLPSTVLVAAIVAAAAPAFAAEPPASMTHRRCYICHSDHEALAGPSFAAIAAWYRKEPDAVRRMAQVIRTGASSGGPWHMPPHPEVSTSEARAMARYILTVGAASPPRRVEANPGVPTAGPSR
jgi:cytochrome c551/c552